MNEQTMTLFDRAKTVGALTAAERYTSLARRKGYRRVTACCPIHTEKTPSCVFYPNGTFHCFGCHAGGSSIDLVMALFHLNALDAAKKLCEDFGLDTGAPFDAKAWQKQKALHDMREEARRNASFTHAVQCGLIRWCDDRLSELDPNDDSDEAANRLETLLRRKQDAIALTEAINELERAQKEDDLEALLRAVQRTCIDRYHLLSNWDDAQGTGYVRGIRTLHAFPFGGKVAPKVTDEGM